ncbi:hypothetical protein [Methylocapsa acidiphila]|uniref:hypothetical protein n=1 Tax=Methylocapsa acidiphila TaxID=133552 RepID=UPI00040342AE
MSFVLKENDAAQIDGDPQQEPPSFIVGRDGDDHWIVVETHGLCGGIFVDEAAAMRYARAESRGRPDAIRLAPSLLVLNMEARSGLRARR